MNVHLVTSSVLALLLSQSVVLLSQAALSQPAPQGSDETKLSAPPSTVANAFKQGLLQRIARQEATVREAEAAHADKGKLTYAYFRLALLYQDAAQWARAEAALEHTISLLRSPDAKTAELATAVSQLGTLHVLMGKLRESEKETQEALKLRLELGDALQIARSQTEVAIVYLKQQKFAKARDVARQAEAEITANAGASPMDRIIVRSTLSEALCYLKDCPSAIPLLKACLDEANATMHPGDFPLGLSTFLLGYAYWKSGNMAMAGGYMEQGSTLMNTQLGWGHPAYLNALRCYAQFLHENRQLELANVIERKIRQAEAVVDVHSIQTAQGMFGVNGLR